MTDGSRTIFHHALGAACVVGVSALWAAATNDRWIQSAAQAADGAPGYLVPEAPIAAFIIGGFAFAMFALWYGGLVDRRWPLWAMLGTAAYLLVLCFQYWRAIGGPAPDGTEVSRTWGLPVATGGAALIVLVAAARLIPPGAVEWTNPRSWSRGPRQS
ncbi:MAG: hypothetical protein O3B31_14575 [Chloroflexi bacterium]|nr:hypothetical protein [Chloroflexota bacterium]MDA1004547.1 hypothetical protein [Chloroflexota bacterium]